ncbi:heterodisulfide reductase-related iron-sulfur binding cluster [Antrihabitans sp. YC2-6]|uniref:heterodisulfide reductase-related iron-sulfur binding cluster n=1 Tax=Antrihabitans sp. YC2-6 TaxID=2799498 RepID=UPI0018F6371A|nr:heterodisulfide reductase-related iron-sulfur binding cluster [Antrihabitans sp. YC2-6]MBJ8345058.1 4Fe-4S dicluster domain-containing protein [Antrihabitans sp. YC2-6]
MNALTMTLGTIGVVLSLVCWASFLSGASRMVRTVFLGQADWTRLRPFLPRVKTMIVEFAAHTRMVKLRTVGIAHWFVMVGFLGGSMLWFEAYGQTFNPEFHWPIIGNLAVYHLWDEILGIGTVVGILTLIVIRQLNHPRRQSKPSRFRGSNLGRAYFVEYVVLVEGLGMIMVKAGKIATYGHSNPWTDFFTMQIAKLLPSSVVMVSVFAFVKLMSGMIWLALVGRKITWGVAWHRFSAFPNIYFKRKDDGSVALGAAKPLMSRGKLVDMEDPADDDLLGVGKIEDFSWKGLLDFTTCTECGRCQSQCPAWNTGKPLSPKLLIMALRDHTYEKAPYLLAGKDAPEVPLVGEGGVIDPDVLWSCTSCGACVEQCPVDIEHVDHIIDMRRYQVMMQSEFPSELTGLFKNLENKGNPWGQNAKDRLNWISEVDFDIPVYGQDAETFDDYEYLFWVGCAGAYEDRAKKTTKAVAELLATAGVKFMVLGAGETCTGDSARRAGNEFLFQQLAQQNIETLNSVFDGVEKRKIVVTCAHCFNTLSNEYPQVGGDYEVVHHTQLLNRLVRQKKLIPVASTTTDVTYHDPCYLGRHNKVYDAPRELMEATGAKLVEMPRHADRSMCCGAGGARMWMEETLGKRINVERVDEALATATSKIATGCPFCKVMLADGVTTRQEDGQGNDVEVVDVAQMMLGAITRLDPVQLSANVKVVQKPRSTPVEVVAETPVAEPEPVTVAAPAAAGKGLQMKGLAKAPGAKAPGSAPAAPTTQPAVKGLQMKGLAKAPGAKARSADAPVGQQGHTVVPSGKGLQIKNKAKAPGTKAPGVQATPAEPVSDQSATKGLPMKGLGKAPGSKQSGKPSAANVRPASVPPTPSTKPKGLALAPGAKAPGRK